MLADLSKRFRHAAIAIANLTPPRREAQWIKSGLISANPSDDFQHRAGLPRRDITEEEFRAILRTTASKHRRKLTPGARFRQVLIFLWRTGARPAEAAQLKWSNVDLKQRIMVLKQHKTVRTKKRQETRNIPLDPVVVRLLEWITKRNEGERVFVTHRGTRIRWGIVCEKHLRSLDCRTMRNSMGSDMHLVREASLQDAI